MHRERVSDSVFWFQSDVYAQVTAGVIAGPHWAVVVDTLALPDETQRIREFVDHELGIPVRYVINTHYHADHAWGNCFFPGATIIAHERCRQMLSQQGIPSLEASKQQNTALQTVKIVLPQLTLNQGQIVIKVGKKHLTLFPTPGHSDDGISVLIDEDRVLFAGDAFMPIPYLVDGKVEDTIASLESFMNMGLENIVQGHGDVILRGEIDTSVESNLNYINALLKAARLAARRKDPWAYLEKVEIEDCGKSRVELGGLAVQLHERNLQAMLNSIQSGNIPGM